MCYYYYYYLSLLIIPPDFPRTLGRHSGHTCWCSWMDRLKHGPPWQVLLFRRPEHRLCHSPCEGTPRAVTGSAQGTVPSGAGCGLRTEGTKPWYGLACDDICSQRNPSSVPRMDEGHWSCSFPGIIPGYVVALILECGCQGNWMWLFVKYSGCSILCCPMDRSTLYFGKY